MAQSYSNIGGTGERRGQIIGSTTATIGAGTVDHMLNGSNSNEFWWNGGQSSKELKFDFRRARVVDEAKWYQSNTSSHGSWKWQGSNDDSTYTDIGSSFTLGGATTQTQTQLNGNTTAYRYYKLLQVSGTTSSSPYLTELEFKIDDDSAYSTSYKNHCATGNRNSRIGFTTSASWSGQPYGLLDGSTTSNVSWWGAESGKHITFDFRNARVIDDAIWFQSNTVTHGTWKWQGSNDGSSFTDIGSTFTLGGLYQQLTELSGNTTAYRYYRLLNTAGTASTSPYLREIQFRIDDESSYTGSYNHARSNGDRTATITLTTTATAGSSSNVNNLIDGAYAANSTDSWAFTAGESSKQFKFDFGAGYLVKGAIWAQSGSQTHGTWKWQGSNDDSTYTDIGSTFTLGGHGQAHTELEANTTVYRYLKLLQTAGTTSGTPWIFEIGFFIDTNTSADREITGAQTLDNFTSNGISAYGELTGAQTLDVFISAGSGEVRAAAERHSQAAWVAIGAYEPAVYTTQGAVIAVGEGDQKIRDTQGAFIIVGDVAPSVRATQVAWLVIANIELEPTLWRPHLIVNEF